MFTYRPYGNDSGNDETPSFTIGLKGLDPANWIEPDESFAYQMAEKDRLFETRYVDVFQARADTLAAQNEVLDQLWDYLPQRHPEFYQTQNPQNVSAQADAAEIHLLPTNRHYCRNEWADAPLALAARLVQDDLVLRREGQKGYFLAAAALCFPSSWSLKEKFNQPLDEIHQTVPGYADNLAQRLRRIFANLQVERPVWRLNWSLYGGPDLFQWASDGRSYQRLDPVGDRVGHEQGNVEPSAMGRCFLRVERQTLRRLPVSRDILFTIRVYHDPLSALETHMDGASIAAGLGKQLAGLDVAQLRYKGLEGHREELLTALDKIAVAV